MRIKTDLYPASHQESYRRRFAKDSRKGTEGDRFGNSKRAPQEHLKAPDALRFSNGIIPPEAVATPDWLRKLQFPLTRDERRALDFLNDEILPEFVDVASLIQMLNTVQNAQSALALDHRLTFGVSPEVLWTYFQAFFPEFDGEIRKANPIFTRTWIGGMEMGNKKNVRRVLKNEKTQGQKRHFVEMVKEMESSGKRSGMSLSRYHIPSSIGDANWAGFWYWAENRKLVKVVNGRQFWHSYPMYFVPTRRSQLGQNRRDSCFVTGNKFFRAREEDRELEEFERELGPIPPTATPTRIQEETLTELVFHHCFCKEFEMGKHSVRTGVAPLAVTVSGSQHRAYFQWKTKSVMIRLSNLGLEWPTKAEIQSFLRCGARESTARLFVIGTIINYFETLPRCSVVSRMEELRRPLVKLNRAGIPELYLSIDPSIIIPQQHFDSTVEWDRMTIETIFKSMTLFFSQLNVPIQKKTKY